MSGVLGKPKKPKESEAEKRAAAERAKEKSRLEAETQKKKQNLIAGAGTISGLSSGLQRDKLGR